jgi:hypothetical protein
MNSMLRLSSFTILVVIWATITACAVSTHNDAGPAPPASQQTRHSTSTFTSDGFTLSLTARCEMVERTCPFRAEIHAPPALFELIQHVEYTFHPDRPKSPAPIMDASTNFRFEAKQTVGGIVYATVTLRGPRGGAPPKVVQIEGSIPFAVEVTPPLPAGLRFEINYRPWYLEGAPHEPVEYLFKIQLLGEPAALKRIKSVEYRLPADESKRPRISHRVESEYFLEGSMPIKEGVSIVAAIRWTSGERSTHTIPLRPRL